MRVFVKPEDVSDLDARKLARDIADRKEKELQYPGEKRVPAASQDRKRLAEVGLKDF